MMEYSCEIGYSGRWAPQMTWTDSDNTVITSSDSGIPGSTVIHSISVEATVERNNDAFTCTTNFGALNQAPGENEADNIPDYQNIQTFPAGNVYCEFFCSILCGF